MIFTFYSYKGGVGRSMAMAGIAHLFARRGLKVLAIDFDLEAPGLERYFFEGEGARSVREQPGLMDLIRAYRRALSDESEFKKAEFKRWDKFRLTAINVAGTLGGSVDLMTAGQREPEEKLREYALAVRSFDWQDFFHNWKGDLFFDWLRRQLRDPDTGYDVVLVDSRTGVTEMGGVCAYQLADAVVLLCAPNYQNLEGTRDVARDFRSDSVLGLRQGRPLEILAIPARLEEHHPKREEFLLAFARELGVDGMPKALAEAGMTYTNLALPYAPEFAIVERLVGDSPAPTAAAQKSGPPPIDLFERLADALTLLADPASKLGRQRDDALARLRGDSVAKPIDLVADTSRTSAGYEAFIEYSPADLLLARELHAALERAGFNTFIDALQLTAGVEWQHASEQALDYSQALLVCFGQPTDTETRARLIARARRLGRVEIIPILLPGADPGALASFDLGEAQALDLRSGINEEGLVPLIARLATCSRHAAPAPSKAPERDPYFGAKPYTEDDAAYFFGREREIQSLRDALLDSDVVLLSGPAQVGKTSLLRAGLIPRIRLGGAGSNEFQLASVSWCDFADNDALQGQRLRDVLDSRGRGRTDPDPKAPFQLVVIDSIDDFAAGASAEARRTRIANITEAVQASASNFKLVLCWRDVLPEPERRAALDEWQKRRFARVDIGPLRGEELIDAIQEPAKRAGHLLEPGLCHRLIEGAGTADNAIAQIQLALVAIWPERRRGWLTNKLLDNAGHLAGVFERHLAGVLRSLTPQQARGAEVLFKSLVVLDSSMKFVAVAQEWKFIEEVPAVARADAVALRDLLASKALIDLRRAALSTGGDGVLPRVDVQVALARLNPAAYFGAADAVPDVHFLLWRSELASLVLRWRSAQERDRSLALQASPSEAPRQDFRSADESLLRGSAVLEAEEWLAGRADELTRAERDFIDASIAAREKAEAKKREIEETERLAFEARERERTEAAEAIAAEKGRQLQIEKKYTARLKRGQWLLASLLVASIGSLAFALVQNERATHAVSQARSAERDLKDLLKTQFGWSSRAASDGNGVSTTPPVVTAGVGDIPKPAPVAKPAPGPTPAAPVSYAGANPELYSVRQSLAANKLIQTVAKPDERERRKAITVEYFAKTADEDKVENALTELGFTLEKPKALLPGIASNAIWFGSPVPLDDVKLVALTLIRAGVQIKTITPSQLPSKKHAALIQVGASMPAEKNPPYTVEEIQAAKEFSR